MPDTNINESFTLPSKGLVYGTRFDPRITLRSMTTSEEMRRLSYSDAEYKTMSGIIEDCIISEKPPISVYDMCIGDYQFLMHKLRVVTYGSEYKMTIQCPNCGEVVKSSVNLDDLEVIEFDEENVGDLTITLPASGKRVMLAFQTPRALDEIKERAKEAKRKNKDVPANFEILYATMSLIQEVDGRHMDSVMLENFVRKLPMKDVYYILQKGDELNRKVGLDTSVIAKCPECGYEVSTQFRIQPEFFGPTFD